MGIPLGRFLKQAPAIRPVQAVNKLVNSGVQAVRAAPQVLRRASGATPDESLPKALLRFELGLAPGQRIRDQSIPSLTYRALSPRWLGLHRRPAAPLESFRKDPFQLVSTVTQRQPARRFDIPRELAGHVLQKGSLLSFLNHMINIPNIADTAAQSLAGSMTPEEEAALRTLSREDRSSSLDQMLEDVKDTRDRFVKTRARVIRSFLPSLAMKAILPSALGGDSSPAIAGLLRDAAWNTAYATVWKPPTLWTDATDAWHTYASPASSLATALRRKFVDPNPPQSFGELLGRRMPQITEELVTDPKQVLSSDILKMVTDAAVSPYQESRE